MKVGLIGNPNVGKSSIFTYLTGIGVDISNFPGTTVDILSGKVCDHKKKVELVDLPGVYSLDGLSDEEGLVRRLLTDHEVDALIVILDATHLERNFYLLSQLAGYDVPIVVLLNMMDEAEKAGIKIDFEKLKEKLGCEVLDTAATLGRNLDKIIPLVLTSAKKITYDVLYDRHIEAAVKSLNKLTGVGRYDALLALGGIGTDSDLLEAASTISEEIENEHQMSVHQIIAANRHNAAAALASDVIQKEPAKKTFDPDYFLTRAFPGLPILLILLVSMLLVVFIVGSWAEEEIVTISNYFIIDPLLNAGFDPLVEEVLFSLAIAIQAGLGIAFPFVFTFYLMISTLEDSGYMTRAAFLADRIMHRFGLHGQAIIPMVLGFGCNVPAVMGIRNLSTKRERIIGSFLITMVPCSARTVIIAGIVATFLGVLYAFSVYAIILVLMIITGLILSKIAPGEPYGMVLEMPPMRWPGPRQVLARSWLNIKEFLFIAMPLLMVSSVILGLLQFYGIIEIFEQMVAPFMEQILGLPDFASTALLFGILRKEMAFETLVVLAGTADLPSVMTNIQLYIFAVVSTLFVPCVSTIAVLAGELGWKHALTVSFYTLFIGVGMGFLINIGFQLFA